MTPLDARDWNTTIITLVFVGLLLWTPFQIFVDWWGNRRDRKRRKRANSDTPSTTPGS